MVDREVAFAIASGFYAAVEQRRDPALTGRPVAVIQAGRVLDLSPEARSRGVAGGLKRSNLFELCPEIHLVAYEAERWEEAWEQLLDLYARHVPAVEPLEITQAFLDVRGLKVDLCRLLGREAWAGLGVTVVFGLGPTKLLARAAGLRLARSGVGETRPGDTLVVSGERPGDLETFLASLSVADLYPLPAEVTTRLERLGFRRAGDVGRLSTTELACQFGWPLAHRIATAAAGGEPDPVRPVWPPPSLEASRCFAGGLGSREILALALGEVAATFSSEMAAKGLAASQVTLTFRGEGGCREETSRRLPRPTRSPTTLSVVLGRLAEELLDRWSGEAGPPVEMMVKVGRVGPRSAGQLAFDAVLSRPVAAAGRAGEGVDEVALGLARRFGGKVVRRAGELGPGQSRREGLLAFYDPLRARTHV